MGISKETIVKTSIEILNLNGIDHLTTRKLAKELNIKSASLYWHMKNMQDLYGFIAEQICSEVVIACDVSNPKEYLYEVHKEFRAKLLGLRDSVAVFIRSTPNTPHRVEIIRRVLECLLQLGIKEKNCITAANLLNNYVLSFVADELRFKTASPEKMKDLNILFGIRHTDDFDEQFLYGLKVLLVGFEKV